MKIVLSWLSDYLDLTPATTPEHIESALIQLGHEVDAITTTGANFPNVVIGHILSREQHPNADKLGVCMVNTGEPEPRQIVCGAPNARAGLTVAVALPGTILPGDFAIKSSKIRDVKSDGMICSQRELGLGTEHNGIWEIEDAKAVIGAPLATILGAPDTVLDVALTPNRGDCFSHLGLARDLAALGLGNLHPLHTLLAEKTAPAIKAATTTADCPTINLLHITGITNGPSPAHIQARLEAVGLRPKNALVDATNYTMLALGQPTHAYDASKLQTETLTATAAEGGEAFAGLNDINLKANKGDVLIMDGDTVVGLGGILGGRDSAVSEATTSVVLEAAWFNPVRTALTGQQHQLHTDARQRFERGVDSALAPYALQFCAHLIAEWTGGKVSAPVHAGEGVPKPVAIPYNPEFFTRTIGQAVAPERQKEILEALGFHITGKNDMWDVTPPTFRTYMATPEDLTEEILRIVGYETITPVLPHGIGGQFNVNGAPVSLDRLARRATAAAGFLEIMTYSFIGQNIAEKFANGAQLLTLANPLAQTDMTTMRPSLLPGLLGALAKNAANSDPTPRLSEVGKVFAVNHGRQSESLMAAGVLAKTGARHWKTKEALPDTFAAKAAAQHILATLGAPIDSATISTTVPPHYHPGRSGTIAVGPFTLATFGELHPAYLKQFDLPATMGTVAVFEVYLEPLLKLQNKARPWQASPYPAVTRDLAFVLPKTVTAQQVLGAVQALKQPLLKSVEVFDHYTGDRIDADKQSLALGLTFQSPEKTLTEADVTPLLQAAIEAVQQQLNGTLRA